MFSLKTSIAMNNAAQSPTYTLWSNQSWTLLKFDYMRQ